MAGPGGATVGSVSVKVTPDTDGFRQKLKTALQRIEQSEKVEIPVELDLKSLQASLKALKQSLEGTTINLDADVDTVGARARIAALKKMAERTRIRIPVDIDNNKVNRTTNALGGLTNGLGNLTNVGGSTGQMLGNVIGGIAKFGALAVALVPVIAGVAGAILALGGAISAALLAIPALLTAIAAPVAGIIIGWQGVADAAKVLKPQVDALRTSLEGLFRTELAPVFEQMKALFPALQTGMENVARSAIGLFDHLVGIATSADGIRNLEAAFRGVNTFITMMTPGVGRLFESMLNLAGLEPLYNILGATIGGVANQLAFFFDSAADFGLLEASLGALQGVLLSVTNLFTQLLEAAMEFFVGAGPGITAVFDGLAAAIMRVDWQRLGENFGRIFQIIGDWLANLSTEQLDMFVNAFVQLGDQVARFLESGGLNLIAASILLVVNAATKGMQAITWLLNALGLMKTSNAEAAASVEGSNNRIKESNTGVAENSRSTWGGLPGIIRDAVSQAGPAISSFAQSAITKMREMGTNIWQAVSSAWNNAVRAVRDGVNRAVAAARALPGQVRSALGNLGGILVAAGGSLIQGFISGIKARIGQVRAAAAQVVAAARAFFPFSPAKEGPFSGKGYTIHSGRALVRDWAKGIEDEAPKAVASIESMMLSTDRALSADWDAHISADGFGGVKTSVYDGVMAAFNGSRLQVDGNGMASLVNKVNNRNARR